MALGTLPPESIDFPKRRAEEMDAATRSLQEVLQGDRRFIIPVYQRPYVWQEDKQWDPLWKDIESTAIRLAEARIRGKLEGLDPARADQNAPPHFLGAIVLEQSLVPTGELDVRLVVDGQQRLATLQLLLRGVLDSLESVGAEKPLQARVRKLIKNDEEVVTGPDLLKIEPRPSESDDFLLAMAAEPPAEDSSKFAAARAFFAGSALDFLQDNTIPEDPYAEGEATARKSALLVSALAGLVKLVVIDLHQVDDAQVIFEALNARGTPLSATDLVKNLIFMRAKSQHQDPVILYDSLWKRFDDEAEWWLALVGIGHAQRARQDWLLGDWMIAERGRQINVGRLYGEFRTWLDDSGAKPIEALATLNRFADAYELLNGKRAGASPKELRAFRNIELLNITAASPVLLWLVVQPPDVLSESERELAIRAIESFVIRRMAAKYQTRGYGQVFVEVLKQLQNTSGPIYRTLIEALRGSPNGYEWPRLSDLVSQLETARYYGPGGMNQERLRLLLGSVDQKMQSEAQLSEPGRFEYGKLQVEHVIPRSWRMHWPIDSSDPIEGAVLEQKRESHLNRIGNLTLITGPLNLSVSNNPWLAKREALKEHSKLQLNARLIQEQSWDEEQIVLRGKWLAEQLNSIWPGPESMEWD